MISPKQILFQQEMLKKQQLRQEINKKSIKNGLAGCQPGDGDQWVAYL